MYSVVYICERLLALMKKCAKILAMCLLCITMLSLAGCACMGTLSGCLTKCGSCMLNSLGKCNSCGVVFCSHCDCLTCLMDDCFDGACTAIWDDCFETSCYQRADKCPADCYPEGNPSDYILMYSNKGGETQSPYAISLSHSFDYDIVGTSKTTVKITMNVTVIASESLTEKFEDVRIVCGLRDVFNGSGEWTYSTRFLPSVKGGKMYSVEQTFYFSNPFGIDLSSIQTTDVTMEVYGVKQ